MIPPLLCNKVRHCQTNKSANERKVYVNKHITVYIVLRHLNVLSFYYNDTPNCNKVVIEKSKIIIACNIHNTHAYS